MNKLLVTLTVLTCLIMMSCSKDDEPKYVNPRSLSGEWFLTNIRGWERDDETSGGKSEFNETFNFNGQGIPVGDNISDAQKILFEEKMSDVESGVHYLSVTSYYWSGYYQEWSENEKGTVKLKGNQLVDGTMKVTITKLTDTTMTTYQKDEDGETFITYARLD